MKRLELPLDQVRSMYESGMSSTRIARELGVSQPTIYNRLVEMGLMRSRGEAAKLKDWSPNQLRTFGRGPLHYNWKGGRRKVNGGYVGIWKPEHPFADQSGYVLEHRLVMEEAISRPVRSDETVHHLNGVHDDNRIENLQLRQVGHGKGGCYECADCGSRNIRPMSLG
jgi:hypothetical protein